MIKTLLAFAAMSTALLVSSAVEPVVIPLWPEGVPAPVRTDVLAAKGPIGPEQVDDKGWVGNISEPRLMVFRGGIDRPTGTAMIICPGGGYRGLSREREGFQYANWLSSLGVTSFVLTSRVGEYAHPAPLQDVLRAIRLVRSRAAEFKIDPARIGVMGSSAGGHLAASAATLFDHPDGKTGAVIDSINGRPDFLILMYPVITMAEGVTHAGSRTNLIGNNPSPEAVELASLEKQVTAATPPALLIHTQDDKAVLVENSIRFYQALTKAGVPAELYVFEHGEHGMGMRDGLGNASEWPKRAEEWLRVRGLLKAAGK